MPLLCLTRLGAQNLSGLAMSWAWLYLCPFVPVAVDLCRDRPLRLLLRQCFNDLAQAGTPDLPPLAYSGWD